MIDPQQRDALATRIQAVTGPGAVRLDPATLLAHSHDAWPLSVKERQLGIHDHQPEMVVTVSSPEEVSAVLTIASAEGCPVTPWGLGSSVTGAPLPVAGGISLDLSRLRGEPALAEVDMLVTVPAGLGGGELEQWLNIRGYTLGHFPQSLHRSTVGGWIATRASGQCSSRYGSIEDLVDSLRVTLADGTTHHLYAGPRAAVGPDLRHLFIGSEGTLGVVTEVTLRVFRRAEHTQLEALSFPDVAAGLRALRTIAQAQLRPHFLRLYDPQESRYVMAPEPTTGCVLLAGCEGLDPDVVRSEFAAVIAICAETGAARLGPRPVERWLTRRYDFSTIEARLTEPGGYAETIELAHLWSRIEHVWRAATVALAATADEVLGHFSHVYTNGTSLYLILIGEASTDEEAAQRIEEIWATALTVATDTGAAISHHHGVGLARLAYLDREKRFDAHLYSAIKYALDPHDVLNRRKLVTNDARRQKWRTGS